MVVDDLEQKACPVMESSVYTVKAFVFGWNKSLTVLDFQGNDSELVERFIYKSVNHETNRKVAEQFGVVVTQVKAFSTDQGWMILDRYTKRPLHRGLKNENEVNELCQEHNYIR